MGLFPHSDFGSQLKNLAVDRESPDYGAGCPKVGTVCSGWLGFGRDVAWSFGRRVTNWKHIRIESVTYASLGNVQGVPIRVVRQSILTLKLPRSVPPMLAQAGTPFDYPEHLFE